MAAVNWVVLNDGEMPVLKVVSRESFIYIGLTKQTLIIACSLACLQSYKAALEGLPQTVAEYT
jgi:hypothetical protein